MKPLAMIISMTLVFAWALANTHGQEEKKLIAQGAYSVVGKDDKGAKKVLKFDEWRMYAHNDGSRSVDIEITTPRVTALEKVDEHYVLTNDLKPRAFSMTLSTKTGSTNNQSGTFSCDFGSREIACRTLVNGVTASATLAKEMPYVFMVVADVSPQDMAWFFQTVAVQARRSAGPPSAIPLVAIEDGDTPDSIALKVQEVENVSYAGQEKIEAAGQSVLAYKFQISEPNVTAPENVWLSESGLLLRYSDEHNASLELTSYDGPPLGQP